MLAVAVHGDGHDRIWKIAADAVPVEEGLGVGVDFPAGFFDQAADVDEDVGRAFVGDVAHRVGEGLFAGEVFAFGGVDHRLEDRFVFGEDDEAVEDPDRGFVFLDLEVDAFV